MLPRPVRPVLKELVHVSPELLKVFGGQVGHMLLQLVNGDQLTVGSDARVLVHTPQQTSCQAVAGRNRKLKVHSSMSKIPGNISQIIVQDNKPGRKRMM